MFGRFKLMLVGALGVLTAISYAFIRGRQDQAMRNERQTLQDYKDTRSRIDEATHITRDADSAREWLRDRNDK